MYANGEVVAQDYQEALKWYQLAAEQWPMPRVAWGYVLQR